VATFTNSPHSLCAIVVVGSWCSVPGSSSVVAGSGVDIAVVAVLLLLLVMVVPFLATKEC